MSEATAGDIMSLEDKARIELTLNTRGNIIREMTKNGEIPKDPNDRSLLMAALDGMDRTVLSRAKIKSDDSAAKGKEAMAKSMAELLLRMDSRRTVPRTTDVENTITLPAIELVEGETYIGVQPVRYAEIMNREN